MNLKKLFTMSRNKEVEKMYFIDKNNREYLLTNLTNAKSGLSLYCNNEKISDDIREINKILKKIEKM